MKNFLQLFLQIFSSLSTVFASPILMLKNHQTPTVWIVKNESARDLIVNHPHQLTGASAGWGIPLQSGRYAALYLSANSFTLSCRDYHSNKIINCHQVLQVLSVPSNGQNNEGTYWRTENVTFSNLLQSLSHGVVIKPRAS